MITLDQEDPLEKVTTTRFSILAWEIPWIEEPGGLQYVGLKRVRHDLATKQELTLPLKDIGSCRIQRYYMYYYVLCIIIHALQKN